MLSSRPIVSTYGTSLPVTTGYSSWGTTTPSLSGIGTTGYGTTVTAPKRRFGFIRRFGWGRDPILGGRHHFIRRWRNASPVLGGPVRHSSMFYGGGIGAGYGLGGLSMWQRLKMRLGFGRVHYGGGSTITANSGFGVAPTIY